MKVTTDGCLFGAWVAAEIEGSETKLNTTLDIGAGTGLLSLMVAQKTMLRIDAVEMDAAAAKQASENVADSGFEGITIFQEDIRKFGQNRYDCIYANPPFYEAELASPDNGRSIAHHAEGLQWNDLFACIATFLEEKGVFFLLLPTKRLTEAQRLLQQAQLHLHKLVLVRQTPDHAPFRAMVRGGKSPTDIISKEVTIRNEEGSYSADFIALLKEYYLYL